MEETKKQSNGQGSKTCAMCGYPEHYQYFFLRWILGIIIILLVFWVGIMIGEFRGSYESTPYPMTHRVMRWNPGGPMIKAPISPAPSSTTPAK